MTDHELDSLVEAIQGRDRSALARAITLVESRRADRAELGQEVLERVLPLAGEATRIGISGMPGVGKEEMADLFRDRVEATLLGVDTFWYGADFPGDTLEVLLLARLPYGVPDRFHHAQCAAL